MTTLVRRVGIQVPAHGPSRPVRTERWHRRAFFASPCRYFIDVPLDMTGCIHGALREATRAGHRRPEGGDVFATDAIFRGAILVEVEDHDPVADLIRVDGVDLLGREVPERGARLRVELDELVRWSMEIGHEVSAVYVRYDLSGPAARPIEVFAALRGDTAVNDPVERTDRTA